MLVTTSHSMRIHIAYTESRIGRMRGVYQTRLIDVAFYLLSGLAIFKNFATDLPGRV